METTKDTIATQLTHKLQKTFQPLFLDVQNESHMHHVPKGSETHFKVILVSDFFNSLQKIKRHQAVYQATQEWMNKPIHALALHLFTKEEWELKKSADLSSPKCAGKGSSS